MRTYQREPSRIFTAATIQKDGGLNPIALLLIQHLTLIVDRHVSIVINLKNNVSSLL